MEKPTVSVVFAQEFTLHSGLDGNLSTSSDEKSGVCEDYNDEISQKSTSNTDSAIHDKEKLDDSEARGDVPSFPPSLNHIYVDTVNIFTCDEEKPVDYGTCKKEILPAPSLTDLTPKPSLNEIHDNIKNENKISSKGFAEESDSNQQHTKLNRFFCEICDKGFHYKSHLSAHTLYHAKTKPFQCELCVKNFCFKSHLDVHMRSHTKEKLFTCEVCTRSFSVKSHLNVHLRTHTNEKPYTCEICNKAFSRTSDLKLHCRSHTGEKPFVCIICNKAFFKRFPLTIHMRIHDNYRPYACDVCNAKFTDKSNLNKHYRIHISEKSFVCDVCNKGFLEKRKLIRHSKIHR